MRVKNEQEVEELALTHISQFEADDYENVTQYAFHTIGEKDGFIRGYTQAQQDLLASASEGFDEYLASHDQGILWREDDNGDEINLAERIWQASRLSMAKEFERLPSCNSYHHDEMSRLQKENEELKKENEELRKDFLHLLDKMQYVLSSNIEPEGCCNGRDCGCLGMPTNPEYYVNQLRENYLTKWSKGEMK